LANLSIHASVPLLRSHVDHRLIEWDQYHPVLEDVICSTSTPTGEDGSSDQTGIVPAERLGVMVGMVRPLRYLERKQNLFDDFGVTILLSL